MMMVTRLSWMMCTLGLAFRRIVMSSWLPTETFLPSDLVALRRAREYLIEQGWARARGLLRTSTRPTLNRRHPPPRNPRVCMRFHPEGKPLSDHGRVLVINDPPARIMQLGGVCWG